MPPNTAKVRVFDAVVFDVCSVFVISGFGLHCVDIHFRRAVFLRNILFFSDRLLFGRKIIICFVFVLLIYFREVYAGKVVLNQHYI